jgi:hypothetical protein
MTLDQNLPLMGGRVSDVFPMYGLERGSNSTQQWSLTGCRHEALDERNVSAAIRFWYGGLRFKLCSLDTLGRFAHGQLHRVTPPKQMRFVHEQKPFKA